MHYWLTCALDMLFGAADTLAEHLMVMVSDTRRLEAWFRMDSRSP